MHRNQLNESIHHQRGSMLVISLFVIIIMAMLGLTMIRLLTSSADAVVHEVYGARALLAAQTALEQTLKDAFPLTQNGSGVCGTQTISVASVPGLQNCTAQSSCSLTSGFIGETTQYYHFQSVATCSAGKVTASRTLAVDAIIE